MALQLLDQLIQKFDENYNECWNCRAMVHVDLIIQCGNGIGCFGRGTTVGCLKCLSTCNNCWRIRICCECKTASPVCHACQICKELDNVKQQVNWTKKEIERINDVMNKK